MSSSLIDPMTDNLSVFADAELISFSTFEQDRNITQNDAEIPSISFVGMRYEGVVFNNIEKQIFSKIKDLVSENTNLKTVMQKNNQRLEEHYNKCVEFKAKYIKRETELKEKLSEEKKSLEELEWRFESYKKAVSSNNISLASNQTELHSIIENEKKNLFKTLQSIEEKNPEDSAVEPLNKALEVLQSFSSHNNSLSTHDSSEFIKIDDLVSQITGIEGSLIDNSSSHTCEVKDLLSNTVKSIQFLNPHQGSNQPISLDHYYDLNTSYDALMMEKNKIKLEYEELSDNYNQVLKVSEQYYAVKKENSEILAVLKEKNEHILYLESQMANRSVIIEPFNGEELNELKNENRQLKNRIKELELENSNEELNKLKNENRQLKSRIKEVEFENSETTKSFSAVDEENCQLKEENEQLNVKNKQLIAENKQLIVENKQLLIENKQLIVENKQYKCENEQLKVENKKSKLEDEQLKNENNVYSIQINEMKELIKLLQQGKTDLPQVRNNQSVYDHLVFQSNKSKEANVPETQISANYIISQQAENQMMTRIRELEEICDKLKCQLDEKTQECVNAKKEVEYKHNQLMDFNDRMHKINASFHDTNIMNQKLTSKLERFNELDEMCAKYKQLLEDKKKEHATINNELIQLKDHIMRLNVTNDNLKKTTEELWKNLNLKSQQLKEKEQVENKIREKDNEICTLKEQMDALNVTIQKMSAEVDSIPVYQTQMDAYENDFRAERAAREKIHQDLCRINEQLDEHILENTRLKEEIKHLTSSSLSDVQQRYSNSSMTGRFNQSNPHFFNSDRSAPLGNSRNGSNNHSYETNQSYYNDEPNYFNRRKPFENVINQRPYYHSEEQKCPKCNQGFPDLDSLQLHVVECLDN
ncbi:optineurin [Hydra vulgaris]|uniref:optineurin n=1 Tax=Hydra vulgaris TaxID=6087 RepID=UPI001F5E3C22|nr:optineurin [Hydra vulgaris]